MNLLNRIAFFITMYVAFMLDCISLQLFDFLQLFVNEEARMEKWVKELYSYRQKALQQGLKSNN